jgi:hypothetical protein
VNDRYGPDVLAGDWKRPPRGRATRQAAVAGLVVEDATTGFCGSIVRLESGLVELEDRHLKRRAFPLGAGFLLDGRPVELIEPARGEPEAGRTRSGSLAVAGTKAQIAHASRLLVEGRHDAELVEKVWGDDLRLAGIVVEILGGIDHLGEAIGEFRPGPGRRLGVLVDHLVPGSKESRIAAAWADEAQVLIVGHPFVDVWQSLKPARLGMERWPVIARDVEWKRGVCAALGWPHDSPADIARAWRQILNRVETYADLEPELLGRVEELIDFVTA